MAKKDLTKREAEKFFGLTETYTEKDLSRAYRKKVSMYHPDLAAARGMDEEMAEEMMVTTNAANALLRDLIAASPDGTVTCEPPKAKVDDSFFEEMADRAQHRRQERERAAETEEDRRRREEREKKEAEAKKRNEEAAAKKREVAYRQRVRKVPAGQYVDADGILRTAYKQEYYWEAYYPNEGFYKINEILGGKDYRETPSEKFRKEGDVPATLERKYKKVENAHYRLMFAALNALIGCVLFVIWTWHSHTMGSPTLAAITIFIVLIAVADLFTGCITRPFRKARIRALDRKLATWRKTHPNGEEKIYTSSDGTNIAHK